MYLGSNNIGASFYIHILNLILFIPVLPQKGFKFVMAAAILFALYSLFEQFGFP